MSPRTRAPPPMTDDKARSGRVVAHYGIEVAVDFGEGPVRVSVSRRLALCVGDVVTTGPKGLLLEERKNLLRRHRELRQPQLVASNVDALLILVTGEPPPRFGFIERAVSAAREQGIAPLLGVNKIDTDAGAAFAVALRERYDSSIDVFPLSVQAGDGVDAVRAAMVHHGAVVIIGPSGVGKSSLTNRLVGDEKARVGALSGATGRGKHTTTVAKRYALGEGAALIDTPGMRDFGLATVDREAFAAVFPGFETVQGTCRFRNCLHDGEPGCAVADAVDEGTIAAERLSAYRQILATLTSQTVS